MADQRKFAYLLLQLSSGLNSGPPMESVLDAMEELGVQLGIKVWSWPVYTEDQARAWTQERIFFSSPNRLRDDNFASWLAENILMLAEAFYGPRFEFSHEHFTFPFPYSRFRRNKGVNYSLLKIGVEGSLDDSHLLFLDQMIRSCHGIPDNIVALAIRAASLLRAGSSIRNAVAFLVQSQRDFYVFPGQLQEALYDRDWAPTKATELARWESSYQSAYKAVEAIVGDPPKDESRYRNALQAGGINPDEEVGYRTKQKIADVIREMNMIRDRRAAHGSTPNRGIELHQMVEFQECARYIVNCAVETAYGGKLY